MSLTFGGTTADRATKASPTGMDDLTSLWGIAWIYPTSYVNQRLVMAKQVGVAGPRFQLTGVAGDFSFLQTATTTHQYDSSGTPLGTPNKWYCVAFVSVFGTSCHLYFGDQTTAMAEVSYTLQQNGVTRTADTGGEFNLANRTNHDRSFPGDVGPAAYGSGTPTMATFEAWRQVPQIISGAKFFGWAGWESASTVKDYSGTGNDLTISGAVVSINEASIWTPNSRNDASRCAVQRAACW